VNRFLSHHFTATVALAAWHTARSGSGLTVVGNAWAAGNGCAVLWEFYKRWERTCRQEHHSCRDSPLWRSV